MSANVTQQLRMVNHFHLQNRTQRRARGAAMLNACVSDVCLFKYTLNIDNAIGPADEIIYRCE